MSALWGWVKYPFYAGSSLFGLGSAALYYYQKYCAPTSNKIRRILTPFSARSSTHATFPQEPAQTSLGLHNTALKTTKNYQSQHPMAKTSVLSSFVLPTRLKLVPSRFSLSMAMLATSATVFL